MNNHKNRLENFKTQRTKIIGDMLDNPDKHGIYPTTKCFEALDALYLSLVKSEAIEFGADYAYRKANPEGKMDTPSIVFEDSQKNYNTVFTQKPE